MPGGTPNGGIIGKSNKTSFGQCTLTSKTATGCFTTQAGTRVVQALLIGGGGSGGSGAAGGGGFQITNSNVCQITTSAQNSSGVTVTHFGIWDAATSGNFLASGSLTTNVDVQLGDTVQFNSGAMAIKVI